MDRYYVNDDGQIEDGQRPGDYQTLDEVEICTLLNRLSAAEAELVEERKEHQEALDLADRFLRRALAAESALGTDTNILAALREAKEMK